MENRQVQLPSGSQTRTGTEETFQPSVYQPTPRAEQEGVWVGVVFLVRVLLRQVAKDLSWRLTDRVETCRELCFG